MGSEILIHVTEEETKVAIIEGGRLVEYFFDRKQAQGIVGNIYKGKVSKVLPGMQAAFVDIGLEKAAFLYVDDIFVEGSEVLPDALQDDAPAAPPEEESVAVPALTAAPAPLKEVYWGPPEPASADSSCFFGPVFRWWSYDFMSLRSSSISITLPWPKKTS